VQVPFAQLTPVFRAKTQPQASPLKTDSIRSLQLMLSKFEYDRQLNPHFNPGSFSLKLRRIAVYS
ncbi:CIA30 family protein, partial [Haemophilus parainfluenzae]|uniref:CIA30 family protein n=1 Tax=Haemophilus parainfluenzae TaxID=729 RepID=UPI00157EF056